MARLSALVLTTTLVLAAPVVAAHLASPELPSLEAGLVDPWLDPTRGTAPPAAVADLRRLNPEYDLMARTFAVLALSDRALSDPEQAPLLVAAMDAILLDTLVRDAAAGPEAWLLPYGQVGGWTGSGQSLFVDTELLVMLGARRLVADNDPRWADAFADQQASVVSHLAQPGVPFAESYPDEAWLFDHAMALVGLRLAEALEGVDHGALRKAVVAALETTQRDAATGLLNSSFSLSGAVRDGPEGSSLWFASTALRLSDPRLAAEQYDSARRALGGVFLGWGYSREWPRGRGGQQDVDSGPLVPGLQASASASGLAIAASAAAGDRVWGRQLERALGAAEVCMWGVPFLREMADNAVGNAVLLWGLGFGPTWAEIERRAPVGIDGLLLGEKPVVLR